MRQGLAVLFFFIILLNSSSIVLGEDLMELYTSAMHTDRLVASAEAQYLAISEEKPIALSELMPRVDFSSSVYQVEENYSASGPLFSDDNYRGSQHKLTLSIPIYRKELWDNLKKSELEVAKAEAELLLARQDLIHRVVTSYFEVLSAKDDLIFAKTEKKTVKHQLTQTIERYRSQVATIVDVNEYQAQYDIAVAREVEVLARLNAAESSLIEFLGRVPGEIKPMLGKLALASPKPDNLQSWFNMAMKYNLKIKSTQLGHKIAAAEVKSRTAKHLPSLDFSADYSIKEEVGGFNEGEVQNNKIGIEFTLPIYQGNGVSAQVRQATSLLKKAKSDLELEKRKTLKEIRTAFLNTKNGINRVTALRKALESTRVAYDTAKKGVYAGTRTPVDVLIALRDVYRSQRDFSNARYDYILEFLELKRAAGLLSVKDLQHLNQYL